MAFLQNNLELEENESQNPLANGLGQSQAPLVGSGSNAAGTGVAQASQSNAGGTGFTNIQTYLNANQNNSGSAQALSNEVGSQFDKERDAFSTDSSKFLSDAEKQVNETKVTTDQADGYIKQGAASYDWGGAQKPEYQNTVGKVQNFLKNDYAGPREYNYGFNAQTQNYGNALKDSSGFDTLMNGIYSKHANTPLTSGQFQLQKQLDIGNEALVGSRNDLGARYEALQKDRDQTVKSTTDKLGGYEQDYRTTQNRVKDFLGNKQSAYDADIANQEYAAKEEYNKLFTEGRTGNKSLGWDLIHQIGSHQDVPRANAGIWSDNLTWNQLQKENDIVKGAFHNEVKPGEISWLENGTRQGTTDALASRRGLLDGFYGEQDAKYANVADEQERAYNTILDFLSSDGERKEKGFKVRG